MSGLVPRVEGRDSLEGSVIMWGKKFKMALRIIQTNFRRSRAAHDLAYATCVREKLDVLVVGEPNKAVMKAASWFEAEKVYVAVLFLDKSIRVEKDMSFQLEGFRLIACNVSHKLDIWIG